HPQHHSHTIRLRVEPYIVVLSGRSFPKTLSHDQRDEDWCRAMVMLFKPWRCFSDMCQDGQLWVEAFDNCQFSEESRLIMGNLQVENECEDARKEIQDV
ncbi:hypothetical protein BDN67DRAFT_872924, partial [Paxillus ammoniavirescens]